MSLSAPRMWRCFLGMTMEDLAKAICSTHVEMFLFSSLLVRLLSDLLHACGDVSAVNVASTMSGASAPRMWRCFQGGGLPPGRTPICSTHVEMFLLKNDVYRGKIHLLHACGDVSIAALIWSHTLSSAPRMWRCFQLLLFDSCPSGICSTHVEMFLRSWLPSSLPPKSAPRMWRCFLD